MGEKSELAKNTAIIGFGRIISQFASFLLLPLYTNLLDPKEYGLVDLIITYIILLAPLIMVQLDRSAFRHLIDARGDVSQQKIVISSTLSLTIRSIAVATILFVLVTLLLDIPYAIPIVAAIIVTIFSNLSLQFARGFGHNSQYAIASALMGITTFIVTTVLVAGLKMGVMGVLLAIISANTTAVLYLVAASRLYRYISLDASSREMQRTLLQFSWPLVPSAISWWFIRASDRTIVSIFLGVAANGVYAAASKYAIMFQALYGIFDLSWTESASAHINSPNRDSFFSEVYNLSFRLFAAIGLGMIATTPFIFGILIGPDFQGAYSYIPILVIGALLQTYVSLYSVIYIAKKITREVMITSVVAAGISLAINVVFINIIGLYAAAVSSAISFLAMAIWRHHDIKKYVHITFTGNFFIKVVILYAIVVTVYYLENFYLNVASLIASVMVAYLWSHQTLTSVLSKLYYKLSPSK